MTKLPNGEIPEINGLEDLKAAIVGEQILGGKGPLEVSNDQIRAGVMNNVLQKRGL